MTSDPLSTEGKTWCIFGHDYPASRGGGAAHWVRALMEQEGRFATGLTRFTLTFVQRGPYVPAHLGNGVGVRDGSDGQDARWNASLARLPSRRFSRKTRELVMTLRGDPGLDFVDRHALVNITTADLQIGTDMVLRALIHAQGRFKASDGVDLGPMIRSAKALLARSWPDDQAMRAELSVAHDLDRARIAAMDPWAKIDMRGFHPQARQILDQPSDWSEGNEFSPHGNDLGADILHNWSVLKSWDIARIADHFQVDLYASTPGASLARMQISLALAFGHIKKSGDCPADLARQARRDLMNHRARAAAMVMPDHLDAWSKTCDRYAAILQKWADR
ncbi:MAG: hypothetical protein MUE52_12005 [Tabrizicola sp.]|nr:hypothetical protein [Tabrizicola sp.]